MQPGYGRQSFLVVFDFDHTVCDCNTDEVIPTALGRSALQKRIIREHHILNANYGHDDHSAVNVSTNVSTNISKNISTNISTKISNSSSSAAARIQWTKLMDTLLAPFSRDELVEATRQSVTVAAGMKDVFHFLSTMQRENHFFEMDHPSSDDGDEENKNKNKNENENENNNKKEEEEEEKKKKTAGAFADRFLAPNYVEVHIASDSNLLFIESALAATMPGVSECLSQIHSNPYYDLANPQTCPALTKDEAEDEAARDAAYNADMTSRKSRLLWYERGGSGCDFCTLHGNKPNMCKSKIIKKLLNTTQLIDPTVIFVGDGGNDYCPVMKVLRPRDFVFARRGFPLHNMLSSGGRVSGGKNVGQDGEIVGGCCAVGLWKDPQELLSLFRAVVQELPFQRLPTMVRFLDLPNHAEFRAVTLHRRMSDIVQRTMSENASKMSKRGKAATEALMLSVANNGVVPPLPGQSVLPAWLRNYAFVSTYNTATQGKDKERLASDKAVVAAADDEKNKKEKTVSLMERRAFLVDADLAGSGARVRNVRAAPRWGQLPWLHGEIYFYHLLWQYVMLKDDDDNNENNNNNNNNSAAAATTADGVVNYISPYDIVNPLYSQHCEVSQTQGMLSAPNPAIPFQDLSSDFLVTDPRGTESGTIARFVQFSPAPSPSSTTADVDKKDGERSPTVTRHSEVIPFSVLTDPVGNGILGGGSRPATDSPDSAAAQFFLGYHDIFQNEKRSVLVNFIAARVVPMLATRPWAAPRTFAGTLLRWMLWGNGLDLSMFTVEQLAKDGKAAAAEKTATADGKETDHPHNISTRLALLMKLRDEETKSAVAQDTNVAGNELEPLAKYLRQLLRAPNGDKKAAAKVRNPANYRVDVVMDNVGVECVADLCFGLWFLHHAEKKRARVVAADAHGDSHVEARETITPTVTYHVKPQPYYVSDVTPRDFEEVLSLLEQSYRGTGTETRAEGKKQRLTAKEKASRKLLKKTLSPFIAKVRAAFASGAFVVDADTVWTQPSEYRDLPPRLINRYFYTQTCIADGAEPRKKTIPNITSSLTTRQAVYAANKTNVERRTALVLFKGDLNFRRVVGDRYWDRSDYLSTLCPTGTNLRTAAAAGYSADLQPALAELLRDTPADNIVDAPSFAEIVSAYWPIKQLPIACIRTIKSEGCIGVSGDKKISLDAEKGSGWRISGKYGVILFAH